MKGLDWVAVALILISLGTFLDAIIWLPLVVLDFGLLAAAGYVIWFRRKTESRPVLEAAKPR
jgi:hypothetical protein